MATYVCVLLCSTGGMQALEWALLSGEDNYIQSAVSIGEWREQKRMVEKEGGLVQLRLSTSTHRSTSVEYCCHKNAEEFEKNDLKLGKRQ